VDNRTLADVDMLDGFVGQTVTAVTAPRRLRAMIMQWLTITVTVTP
jgi:hypothetical protein